MEIEEKVVVEWIVFGCDKFDSEKKMQATSIEPTNRRLDWDGFIFVLLKQFWKKKFLDRISWQREPRGPTSEALFVYISRI